MQYIQFSFYNVPRAKRKICERQQKKSIISQRKALNNSRDFDEFRFSKYYDSHQKGIIKNENLIENGKNMSKWMKACEKKMRKKLEQHSWYVFGMMNECLWIMAFECHLIIQLQRGFSIFLFVIWFCSMNWQNEISTWNQ